MNMRFFWFLAISVFLSCQAPQPQQEKSGSTKRKHGLVKSYDEDGHLKTTITYAHGIKHGMSTLYYEGTDQPLLKMPYKMGKRNGIATKYYENGSVYAETPYVKDEVSGTVNLYYRNGNLKAEVPYYFSKHGLGLKEYFTNGSLKTDMPEIDVKIQDTGVSKIYFFSIENCSRASFYVGSLLNNQFLMVDPAVIEVLPIKNGVAYFKVPQSRSGTFNVICECRTKAKNPYITRKVIQL